MAEAAPGKEPELSSAYYTHKRSALLGSAALLVLSLADPSKTPTVSFEGVSIAIGGDVTLFLLAAGSLYYTALFWVLWLTESSAYARAKLGTHPQLEVHALGLIDTLARTSQDITNSVRSMDFSTKRIIVEQFLRTLTEDFGEEQAEATLQTLYNTPGWQFDLNEVRANFNDLSPDQGTALLALEDMIRRDREIVYRTTIQGLIAIGQKKNALYSAPIDELTVAVPGFIEIMEGLQRTLDDCRKPLDTILKSLAGSTRLIKIRLLGFDLAPCLALSALATLHYIGRYHPVIPITLADLPVWLGLTR
jgi:Arc/MetJ family transcription regulator